MAGLAAVALISLVAAHSEPARIKPGDGAVLTSPPVQIEIHMTQDMARTASANDIDVFDASGTEVTTVAAAVANGDRKLLTVAMPPTLAPGVYTVKWKTLSADDGDAADGQFTFTYDPSGTASEGTEQVKEDPLATGSPTAGTGEQQVPGTNAPVAAVGGDSGGTSWVLVTAVAVGMFVAGGGTAFLLVQKKS